MLAVCGDGGFMMNSQEMETAVRLKLNLVVLILEDNAYGMIRWKQAVDGFPDFGLTFGNPDFVAYAEGLWREGKPGRDRRRSRARARSGLRRRRRASVVVTPVDYREQARPGRRTARQRVDMSRGRCVPYRGTICRLQRMSPRSVPASTVICGLRGVGIESDPAFARRSACAALRAEPQAGLKGQNTIGSYNARNATAVVR